MPTFDDAATTPARPEDVWKALYDPARFPEWWAGIGTIVPAEEEGRFTMYPAGYPDFPMPQTIQTARGDGRVTVSCQVSDLVFEWRLSELAGGGTGIAVHVEIPDAEAHRLDAQRAAIRDSLARLAALTAGSARSSSKLKRETGGSSRSLRQARVTSCVKRPGRDAGGRRGTSCAPPCCDAARRA
jgi:uncharacterized protein YndB with AHSA1/START domain